MIEALVSLGRCFKILHAMSLSQLVCLFLGDHSLADQISLISADENINLQVGMPLNVLDPASDSCECSQLVDVKSNNYSIGLPIKLSRNCLESFLACSVPQFYLYLVASRFYHFGFLSEIYPQSCHMFSLEIITRVLIDY